MRSKGCAKKRQTVAEIKHLQERIKQSPKNTKPSNQSRI